MARNLICCNLKEFLERVENTSDPSTASKHFKFLLQPLLRPSIPSIVRYVNLSVSNVDLRFKLLIFLVGHFGEDTGLHDELINFLHLAMLEPNDILIELITAIVDECGNALTKTDEETMKVLFGSLNISKSAQLIRLMNSCIVWNNCFIPFAKALQGCTSDDLDLHDEISDCQVLCNVITM